jgi:pyridoxine 5-phosphate synthase
MAMLVPEGRQEVTTEGGSTSPGRRRSSEGAGEAGSPAPGIVTSVFIDAELTQVEAAHRIGARVCEIHTGPLLPMSSTRRVAMREPSRS